MAKNYRKKTELEEIEIKNEDDNLSKKEQYDLAKQRRMALKEKDKKKKDKSLKKGVFEKAKGSNIGARIFAIAMLVLMVSSVIISTLAYVLN